MKPAGILALPSIDEGKQRGGAVDRETFVALRVLNANPLEDIHNTANIAMVMKSGKLYDADTLDEIWPEKKAFGTYYWVNLDALRNDTRGTDWWDQKK